VHLRTLAVEPDEPFEVRVLGALHHHDWTFTVEDSNEDLEARATNSRAYQDLFPLASDGFLRVATAFHVFVWVPPFPNFSDETDLANFHRLWADLVLNMRKDAHVRSLVKRDLT
jgi:hypothetical protein